MNAEEEARQKMKEERKQDDESGSNGDDPNGISRQWNDGVYFEVGTDYQIIKPISQGWYWYKYSAKKTQSDHIDVITKFPDPFLHNRFKLFLGDYSRFVPVRILREIVVSNFLEPHLLFLELKDVIIPQGRETEYDRWSLEDFNDVYLVHEATDTNLEKMIDDSRKQGSGKQLYHLEFEIIFAQLIIGLHYMKQLKVIHGNLDPLNLLVKNPMSLKISDFANSTLQKDPDPDPKKKMTLTVQSGRYSAPELLLGCRSYNSSVDVWSAACILGATLKEKDITKRKGITKGKDIRRIDIFQDKGSYDRTNHLREIMSLIGVPSEEDLDFIDDEDERILVNKIIAEIKADKGDAASESTIASSFPVDTSKSAIDILKLMLVFNPNKRIKLEEALHHEYIADHVQFWKDTNEGSIKYPITDDMWDAMDEDERLSDITSGRHLWVDLSNKKQLCSNPFDDINDDRKLRGLLLTEMLQFHPSLQE